MKRPLPTQCISQQVKVYGYTTAAHKRPLWFSVMQRSKVAGHAVSVVLENVSFEINKAGETKSREGVKKADGSWLKKPNTKTPYAFVCGTLQEVAAEVQELDAGIPVRFYANNRRDGYFGDARTGERLYEAKKVVLTTQGVMAYM